AVTDGGVVVSGSSNVLFAGNLIGTDHTGTVAGPNKGVGVQVENGNDTAIGSNVPGAGNPISGNARTGTNGGGGQVRIQGNKIGTTLAGDAALPNTGSGVFITNALVPTNLVTVGGSSPGMGNVISGNTQSGVFVQDVGSNDVVILGNYIGTNA